jgi:hypothetical protein
LLLVPPPQANAASVPNRASGRRREWRISFNFRPIRELSRESQDAEAPWDLESGAWIWDFRLEAVAQPERQPLRMQRSRG